MSLFCNRLVDEDDGFSQSPAQTYFYQKDIVEHLDIHPILGSLKHYFMCGEHIVDGCEILHHL